MQNPGGAATHSSAPSVSSNAEGPNGARLGQELQAERAAAAARHGLETARAVRARRRDRDLDDSDDDADSIFGGGDEEDAPRANGTTNEVRGVVPLPLLYPTSRLPRSLLQHRTNS